MTQVFRGAVNWATKGMCAGYALPRAQTTTKTTLALARNASDFTWSRPGNVIVSAGTCDGATTEADKTTHAYNLNDNHKLVRGDAPPDHHP